MNDLDLKDTPNPFSIFANERRRTQRKLISAASFLTAVVLAMILMGLGQGYWQRFKIANLTAEFAQQSPGEKIERLRQLNAYDEPALAGLADALIDSRPEVSEFAFELLTNARKSWTTLPEPKATARRAELSKQLRRVSAELPQLGTPDKVDTRFARLKQLAHAIAQDEITAVHPIKENLDSAMQVVSMASPEIQPRPDSAQGRPLPIETLNEEWSDWPPNAKSLPRLFRKSYPTLSQVQPSDVAESQEPQLLRPSTSVFVDATEVGHSEVGHSDQIAATERYELLIDHPAKPDTYWAMQLNSRNRRVRLRAIHELELLFTESTSRSIQQILADHAQIETDPAITSRLNQILSGPSLR